MVLWIVAGYCLVAALFYSYIVATAELDPTETAGTVVRTEDQHVAFNNRKAA